MQIKCVFGVEEYWQGARQNGKERPVDRVVRGAFHAARVRCVLLLQRLPALGLPKGLAKLGDHRHVVGRKDATGAFYLCKLGGLPPEHHGVRGIAPQQDDSARAWKHAADGHYMRCSKSLPPKLRNSAILWVEEGSDVPVGLDACASRRWISPVLHIAVLVIGLTHADVGEAINKARVNGQRVATVHTVSAYRDGDVRAHSLDQPVADEHGRAFRYRTGTAHHADVFERHYTGHARDVFLRLGHRYEQ